MIQKIHHTAISTPDLERSIAFYRDLFGFEVVLEMAWPVGSKLSDTIMAIEGSAANAVMLRRGDSMIEVFQFSSPDVRAQDTERPVCDHGITHICFLVDDIRGEYARLSEAGMRFHCPPQDVGQGAAYTYGRDPDGNVIELLEVYDEKNVFHVAS